MTIGSPMDPNPEYAAAWRYQDKDLVNRLLDRTTLPRLLAHLADPGRDVQALTWYDGGVRSLHFNYRELVDQIRSMASWLFFTCGVQRGDRLVVVSGNCPEVFVAHLAIMSLGAITVPVNNFESERVLRLIVEQVTPRVMLSGRSVGLNLQTVAKCKVFELPQLPMAQMAYDAKLWFWPCQEVVPDDPAVILYTSGTTSSPKGVCLSHYNLMVNSEGLARTHNLALHRTHMCILPLFHANAFGYSMIGSIYSSCHVVLSDGFPGMDIWSILRGERVDILSTVPQILKVLAQIAVPRDTLHDLKYVVSAAAPLPKSVAQEFCQKTAIDIHQGYGLSECVNFAATVPWNVSRETLDRLMQDWTTTSIGPALFGCEMGIRRYDGTPAQEDEEGEIVVSGHNVMLGYWRAEEATRAALGRGYLSTGDLGFFVRIGQEPHYFVTGRKKEIIIRYGENISPFAIEAELDNLRQIGPFAVTGFFNEAAGEEIGLYIVTETDSVNEKRILDIVRKCVARYRPRVVIIGYDHLPATPTGKIKRAFLARKFQQYATRIFGSEPIVELRAGKGHIKGS
jgi:acyl-CoA synthetase (AMP-forming)/AMP-acid ligase II